jgi:hypothetical protein
VHPIRVAGRLGGIVDGEVAESRFYRPEEAQNRLAGRHADRERVHLDVAQPGPEQVEVVGDARHVDYVVRGGVGVEVISGNRLLGA